MRSRSFLTRTEINQAANTFFGLGGTRDSRVNETQLHKLPQLECNPLLPRIIDIFSSECSPRLAVLRWPGWEMSE